MKGSFANKKIALFSFFSVKLCCFVSVQAISIKLALVYSCFCHCRLTFGFTKATGILEVFRRSSFTAALWGQSICQKNHTQIR